MGFLLYGATERCSNKLHINQDEFGAVRVRDKSGQEIVVAAVADGITRSFQSKYASYNTVRWILNWGIEYFTNNIFRIDLIDQEIDHLLIDINHKLNQFSDSISEKKKKLKAGDAPFTCCTVCGMITNGDMMALFNVGDSAIYEIKEFVFLQHDKKQADQEGRILSHIGGMRPDDLDIIFKCGPYNKDSIFFLCTDGMYNRNNMTRFQEDLRFANSRNRGLDVLREMIKYVQSEGETDDITALVVRHI